MHFVYFRVIRSNALPLQVVELLCGIWFDFVEKGEIKAGHKTK